MCLGQEEIFQNGGIVWRRKKLVLQSCFFFKYKTPLTVPEVRFSVLYHTELSQTIFNGEIIQFPDKQQRRLCKSEGLNL